MISTCPACLSLDDTPRDQFVEVELNVTRALLSFDRIAKRPAVRRLNRPDGSRLRDLESYKKTARLVGQRSPDSLLGMA
jgi:hypothetical protein